MHFYIVFISPMFLRAKAATAFSAS